MRKHLWGHMKTSSGKTYLGSYGEGELDSKFGMTSSGDHMDCVMGELGPIFGVIW
jgi:hypothetical protein